MKSLTRIALPAALLLAACGDDITEINANVGAVETSKDLPECTKNIAGQTAFIIETHEFLGCDGSEWQSLSASTVSVGDNVCMSKSLSDGAGFEIFCNGESIGTVKNGVAGKDGVDGKDGADGEPGAKGDKGDKGDDGAKGDPGDPGKNGTNGTNGTSCEISEATALTATIACGSETFTMDLTGYVEQPAECDASLYEDCTGSLDNVELSGVSQKGPFVTGTDITAYELENGRSLKQTGKTFGGKIERADGTFDIKTVKLKSTFAYLVADGFYRNEVTGENSAATIKLRALTNLQGRTAANINLVTHLEYDRVQRLVTKDDSTVLKAKQAAEREIFAAFDIDSKDFKGFAEDFNILEEGDGNAALLAISALLQGDRNESELTALLAALSGDLGDNGEWDNERQRAQIADWAMKKDIEGGLAAIRANIKAWKLRDGEPPAFEGHFRNFWMKELGVGECSADNAGALFATKNAKSAYYAANDSVYTEGDSSLVRLICDASGAWRFATDLEKDTAAFDPSIANATAMAGNVNTDIVYVKEGAWRGGTELDKVMKFSCVADSVGKVDSIIVKNETVWYICDRGYEGVPYAWREPTTAEADTVGFGTPDGEAARAGNVDESHVYVYEDTSGKGDYAWRRGTSLDMLKELGPCTKNNLDTVKSVTVGETKAWYTCASDQVVLMNNKLLPCAWREATDIEKDTVGWGKSTTVAVKSGNVNENLVYVFENDNWRHGTAMDLLLGVACTEEKADLLDTSTKTYGGLYYVCTPQPSTPDTVRKWVPASDIYNDTHDALDSCKKKIKYADGAIMVGRVNTERMYVCDNGEFRPAKSDEISYNRACVSDIKNQIFKVNGVLRRCTETGWKSVVDKATAIVKDAAGKEYKTIVIGTQHWMKENLDYATANSYCHSNDVAKCAKYGRLYTWTEAMSACPVGWHIPTLMEWNALCQTAEIGTHYEGAENPNVTNKGLCAKRLKSQTGWNVTTEYDGNGLDALNFTVLPAGAGASDGSWFYNEGVRTHFWTSTMSSLGNVVTGNAFIMEFYQDDDSEHVSTVGKDVNLFSARCIQDD